MTRAPEDLRRHPVRRAVGTVEHDGHSAEIEEAGAARIAHVVRVGALVPQDAPDLGPDWLGCLVGAGEPRLDLLLPGIRELGALRGEDLDPIVGERVVRGGQNDAAMRLEPPREEGDGRRRQDTDRVDIATGGQGAGDERGLEHGARQARVAPDDQPDLLDAVMVEQRRHELPSEPEGQLGGQGLHIGDAADPVGAEQPAHERGAPFLGSPGGEEDAARVSRIREGLMRRTVMPGGTVMCSGSTRSVTSPGSTPARLRRALS